MKPLGDRTRLLAAALLFAAAAVHAVAAYEADHLETQLFYVFWGIVIVQVTVGLIVPLPGEEMAEPVELLGLVSKAIEIAALPFLVLLTRPAPEASTPTVTPKAT